MSTVHLLKHLTRASTTSNRIRTQCLGRKNLASSIVVTGPARQHSNSVDSHEINHFNALASTWWDPHGPSRLLHLMNPLRHSFISSCLASQSDALPTDHKLNYLDIGCGGGIFAESAARLPGTATVTGVDPSTEVLSVAKTHARKDPLLSQINNTQQQNSWRLRYLNLPVEQLPSPGAGPAAQDNSYAPQEGYDIITLFEVLEHVPYPAVFLQSILPHLRPGGWLILSTIARTWTSWVTTKLIAEDVLRIVPRGTHDWQKYLNEDEIRRWFVQLDNSNNSQGRWISARAMGVVYVPGVGWREVRGGENWGNYFFGVRKSI